MSGTTGNPPPPQMPTSQHVVLVMEENQSYSSVAGNKTVWPNLNALMKAGAQPTNYYADAHFSIPNYFMLTTGQPLTFDDNSTQVFNVDNIARHMLGLRNGQPGARRWRQVWRAKKLRNSDPHDVLAMVEEEVTRAAAA